MSEPIEEHPRGESAPDAADPLPGPVLPPHRRPTWGVLKVFGVVIVLFVGLSVWGTCFWWINATTPPRAWKKDAFVLEGQFREDGSCTVTLDGQPLWPGVAARTEFDAMSIHGAAPEAFDVPQVECGVPQGNGYFFVWGSVEKGTPVRSGRYRIVTDALSEGDTTAWEATLFHSRFDEDRAYLIGYEGYVRFSRADSTAVAGTFRVVARRKLRGPI